MSFDMNPYEDEDEEGYKKWLDSRDDPKAHKFVQPCGANAGEDRCWLCGNPEIAHAEFNAGERQASSPKEPR